MENYQDSIKFMMAKIFFSLANFCYKSISDVTPLIYHGMETVEINFVEKGIGKVRINDELFEIKDNSFFVIPEFIPYSIIPSEELKIYSIYLLVEKKTGYEEYLPFLTKTFVGNDSYDLLSHYKSLHYEFKTKKFGYNEIIVSNMKSIIVKILRNANMTGKKLSHWDKVSLQFEIESILFNEFSKISVIELADRLHMSVRELQRYLNKNYNKTFNDLKTEMKMSFAANKLEYSDISINELSELVGFSTSEHFSYSFKKYFGESPISYRKRKKS